VDVEHTLIWTRVPVFHPDLIHESIKARIDQDGLWGFTGCDSPPPSPSSVTAYLPSLADWGVTMDSLIRSSPPMLEETMHIKNAGREVHRYVQNRWSETEWEAAWFVNPPVGYFLPRYPEFLGLINLQRIQSVPGLSHFHVLARRKSAGAA